MNNLTSAWLFWTPAIVLLGMAASWLRKTLRCLHLFTPLADIKPPHHRVIRHAIGAEDIVITRDGHIIASSDRRSDQPSPTPGGCLLRYDAAWPRQWETLWGGDQANFHPHGIAHYLALDGSEYLYVINHAHQHDQVEIFRLISNKQSLQLAHVRSVAFPGIRCLNDLTVVGDGQFYVTVDHGSNNAFLNHLADYLRLPTAYVLYHDGQRSTCAASRIVFANGIAAKGNQIYVASTLLACIIVYQRDDISGRLFKRSSFDIGGSPDNITMTEQGDLLVAVHPKILALAKQRKDRHYRAPSLVRKVHIDAHGQAHIRTLYGDNGQQLACASVAVQQAGRMWIGSVYDDRIVLCEGLDFNASA